MRTEPTLPTEVAITGRVADDRPEEPAGENRDDQPRDSQTLNLGM